MPDHQKLREHEKLNINNLPIADRIIREKERRFLTSVSTSSWWRLEKAGLAPKGFKLGPASKGWMLGTIRQWMVDRANGGLE